MDSATEEERMALTNADLDEVILGERGILRGIDACVQAECLVSAVTLIYSGVDALAALTRPVSQPDTTRREFIDWVNTYMRPTQTLGCTAEDLYGARCGVLHKYGPHSKIRREGKARFLVYAWREGPTPDAAQLQLPLDTVYICVEDLVDAFRSGAADFQTGIAGVPGLWEKVNHHLGSLLCYRPCSPIRITVAA